MIILYVPHNVTGGLWCRSKHHKVILIVLLYFPVESKGDQQFLSSQWQTLSCGLQKALQLCELYAFSSVAFPIIGPGLVLNIPSREAAKILTDEIGRFGQSGPEKSLSTIRIIIQPNHGDFSEASLYSILYC